MIRHPLPLKMQDYKIATANLNRIQSEVKLTCLKDYLYAADIDIAFLQEVVTPKVGNITGYEAIINIGDDAGTAILFKAGIACRPTAILDTGRGIAAQFQDLLLINIYAPTGSTGRKDRSIFYRDELVLLLSSGFTKIILGGDFNCVLRKEDQCPNFNFCLELQDLTHGLDLQDTWCYLRPQVIGYTYVTATSASRLDRLYISKDILSTARDCEIWPVNFSDHCAYHLTFRHAPQKTFLGRGVWQLNVELLDDANLRRDFIATWQWCLQRQGRYRERVYWWTELVKPKIKKCICQFARARAYWKKQTLEFYFTGLRQLYNDSSALSDNLLRIKRTKAKITALVRQTLAGTQVRARSFDDVSNESASLFHIVRESKRGRQKIIQQLTDDGGNVYEEQGALKTYVRNYFRQLYSEPVIDVAAGEDFLSNITATVNEEDHAHLLANITNLEVRSIITCAAKHKAAGLDGLPVEFYVRYWDVIGDELTTMYNELLTNDKFPSQFTEGMIVLVPKTAQGNTLGDFRPLTLLNADFKIFSRIVNARLKPVLGKILGPYQMSVVSGRSMLTALSEYRDIAYLTWICKTTLAITFFDFDKAFDRTNHSFLFRTLVKMGFNQHFVQILRKCISNTCSRLKFNGQLTASVPLQQGLRQGCPLSTTLFAIAIEPLLKTFHVTLPGLQTLNTKTVCHAYADDISVIINNREEEETVRRLVQRYVSACGAKLNERKSKVLHLGPEAHHANTTWLESTTQMKHLGLIITSNPREMVKVNWQQKLNVLRAMIRDHNMRSLDRIQRALFVNSYVFSKIYHIAAILPIPTDVANRILALAGWYIWRGNILKVAFKATALPRIRGGLAVKDVELQCLAIFLTRTSRIIQSTQTGLTRSLFKQLRPRDMTALTNVDHIHPELVYVRKYYVELSHVSQHPQQLNTAAIYSALSKRQQRNPIESKYAGWNWRQIWMNISNPFLRSRVSCAWYDAVNEVIPTGEKMFKINLRPTPNCEKCGLVETLEHLLHCRDQTQIWNWTRKKLALINRTTDSTIRLQDIFHPDWQLFPKSKNNSYTWLVGQYLYYMLTNKQPMLYDFHLYLTTEYRSIKRLRKYKEKFQNFLTVALNDGML